MKRLFSVLAVAVGLAAMAPSVASAQAPAMRTVIAVDVSGSMGQGNRLEMARDGARDIVAKRGADEQIALLTFGERSRVVVPFTVDAAKLQRGINAMVLDGATALWDAVRLSTELLNAQPSTRHRLVVFSDGDDTVSAITFEQARAAVANTRTVVSVIALPGAASDGGRLGALARESGGQFTNHSTLDPTDKVVPAKKVWNPLGGAGKWVALGSSLLAALLLVSGVLLLIVRRESIVDKALAPYSGAHAGSDDEPETQTAFAQTAFVKRAIALTGRLANKRGLLTRLDARLEQADLPIRSAELLFFAGSAVALIGVIVLAAMESPFLALCAAVIAALLPVAAVNFIGARKRKKFVSQLPDTLGLISGALRAGFSFLQAVESTSSQLAGPMGRELRRIVAESRLGRELEESMEETARRMSSDDFDWVVMAVRIQREVGGNLAEVLDNLAETMVVRDRLRREIKALTAEGRISMVVLGIMPVGLALFLYIVNPDYISILFEEPLGRVMAGASAVMAAFGVFWMKKTTEIEL